MTGDKANLVTYVKHTAVKCGLNDDEEGLIDVHFFKVKARKGADKRLLVRLVEEFPGDMKECNPFDGKEHNFMDLGAWIGTQELALLFMGLAGSLNLCNVMSPNTMLGDMVSKDAKDNMAKSGFISMQYVPEKHKPEWADDNRTAEP
jgi:hypothetical protein